MLNPCKLVSPSLSVGPGDKERKKFSSTGERAPGYRLSPDHLQTVRRMLAPDWAEKCFVLFCPIGEQHLLSSFCMFVHDGYCLAILFWHGNGQVIVGTLGLFCQWLKPFVAGAVSRSAGKGGSPRMS